MLNTQELQQSDSTHYLHPFTDAKSLKKKGARVITRAEGIYLWDSDGNRLLDGMAGLWCVNAGHCREKIVKAVQEQVQKMDYGLSFQMGHGIAFKFASKLVDLLPSNINHVFFSNSGSEAVDSALKIVLAYFQAKGKKSKT